VNDVSVLTALLSGAPGEGALWIEALGSDPVRYAGPVCKAADLLPQVACLHDSCRDVILEGAMTEFRRLEAVRAAR
jgi:hypothetical protein